MIDGPEDRVAARPRARGIRRGAYLLPSLFTMGNMVSGFYAIILGINGLINGLGDRDFEKALLFIVLAAALDSVDGRIARMTGTESEFGKEYDSLADVITFGAAPGMLAYLWGLRDFNRDTWLLSVFYMVCTATRLARFNVQTRIVDSRYFVGLPSPWAALTICALLWFSLDATGDLRTILEAVMGAALLVVGTLMVSTFRYNSFKKLNFRRRWSYRALVPIAVIALLIVYQLRALVLALALLYTLSGPASAALARLRPRRGRRPEEVPPPPPLEGAP